MVFNDYYNKVKSLAKSKNCNTVIVDRNLEKIFENYINDTPVTQCIKELFKSNINESTTKNSGFKKYAKRVITLLETFGYDKSDIDDNTIKNISDNYDVGEDEYACAELCKNDIEKAQKYKPIKLTPQRIEKIKNNLLINLHAVDNAALLDLNVSPTAATVKIKIRLLANLNNIETDVKSYIKLVHKYLSAFLVQNSNTDIETNVKGYAIKYNNLYCTSEFTIPFIEADGTTTEKFNIYDISRSIKSHLNVIETFIEQYKNILK